MRTLQEKYNGIQEGKFSKEHFLAEARMQQPQLITRFNGYDDAVQILKNRGMIQEAKSITEFSPYGSIAFSGEKEKQKETAPLSSLQVGDVVYVQGVSGDNLVVKDKKEDGTVGVGHPHNDKVSYQDGNKEVQVVRRANLEEAKGHSFTISFNFSQEEADIKYIQKLLNKAGVKATVRIGNYDELVVFTAADKTELEKAKKIINSNIADEFEYVKNINEAKQTKLTKKSLTDYRYKPTNDMDKYPYEQILRGIRVELETLGVLGTPTAEEYSKALSKVSKNLEKDSIYYTNQVAGVNPKVDLHDKMVTATAKNTVDTFNGMKKAALKEGFKKLIKKVLSESSNDLADLYKDDEPQGKDEYDFYSNPENYNEEEDDISHPRGYEEASDEEEFELQGDDLDESRMGDVHILAQESDTLKDFLMAVKQHHPEVDIRRDIEELQDIWNNRQEDEIDYDDENFSDPFIDGEDDLFEGQKSLSELLK